MARVLDLEPMLIYKRLVPAVQALTEHAADRSHSGSRPEKIPSLVGGVPEDAEEENT
jgi:hypothetical protein